MARNKYLLKFDDRQRQRRSDAAPKRPISTPAPAAETLPAASASASPPASPTKLRDGFKDEATGIYHPSPSKTKQFLKHSEDCHSCADEAKQLGLA